MPLINVRELMNDADFVQDFQVIRTDPSTGQFTPGGFDVQATTIPMRGISEVAQPRTLQMVPEGDRVLGSRTFWSKDPIYETEATNTNDTTVDPTQGRISDVILYHGEQWKVVHVWGWQDEGYYKALAVRMRGN
jgi:hypothetical protein